MRADPDHRQEARLALIERGGPSSVSNPEAWVEGTAKRLQAASRVRDCRELVAWCHSEGIFPDNYEMLIEVAYQRDRQRKPREVRSSQQAAWRLKNRDRANAKRRELRAARKLLGLPYQ